MKFFVDTSALVKLFQEEIGSRIVEDIVNDDNNNLWILDLSKIEFYKRLCDIAGLCNIDCINPAKP